MAPSAFDDPSAPPRPDEVAAILGAAAVHWDDLKRRVAVELGPVTEQWGFTSRGTGWGLRLKLGDRIIAYLAPRTDHFLVSFVLGEKAVEAAHAGGLPAPVLALIDRAADTPRAAA